MSDSQQADASALFDSPDPIEPGASSKRPVAVPPPPPAALTCPACGFEQEPSEECLKCGLVISKFRPRGTAPQAPSPAPRVRSREEIAGDLAGEDYAPRERVSATAAAEDDGFFAPERRGLDKGIVGGVVMMAIAVVWFGLGWMAGYIFFYPPILFVIGLFGTLKGIFAGNVAG